jgi:hypothetical protein
LAESDRLSEIVRNTVQNKIKAYNTQKGNTISQSGHNGSGAASDIFGLGTFTLTGTSGTGGEDDLAQNEADRVSGWGVYA